MSSEEFRNKEVHAERVKRSARQSMVMISFKSNFPEEWGSSNDNNNFSKMTTFEECNYGDVQRGNLPRIKKGIINDVKASRSSFDYAFAYHPQARLLCNYLLTRNIDFLR